MFEIGEHMLKWERWYFKLGTASVWLPAVFEFIFVFTRDLWQFIWIGDFESHGWFLRLINPEWHALHRWQIAIYQRNSTSFLSSHFSFFLRAPPSPPALLLIQPSTRMMNSLNHLSTPNSNLIIFFFNVISILGTCCDSLSIGNWYSDNW